MDIHDPTHLVTDAASDPANADHDHGIDHNTSPVLDECARNIFAAWTEHRKSSIVTALLIGEQLCNARDILRTAKAFDAWLKAQGFEFSHRNANYYIKFWNDYCHAHADLKRQVDNAPSWRAGMAILAGGGANQGDGGDGGAAGTEKRISSAVVKLVGLKPDRLTKISEAVPGWVSELIDRLTVRNPDAAKQMVTELQRMLSNSDRPQSAA